MALAWPPMKVTFEDGTELTIEPRPKDLARAEYAGCDFQSEKGFVIANHVAYATVGRLFRSGVLPDGFVLPESFDAWLDAADVEHEDEDGEGEGEAQGQAATSG